MEPDATARHHRPPASWWPQWLSGPWAGAALVAVALVYGWLTSRIEAPDDASVFWVGNLAAPYLILPAVAGATRRTRLRGAMLGALTGAAMVFGFYGFFGVGDVTYSQLELGFDVTPRDAMLEAYGDWFRTFLLGDPGGRPWLAAALLAGGVMGALGHRGAWHGSQAALAVAAAALILEPLVYLSGANRLWGTPRLSLTAAIVAVWALELATGAALAWLAWRRAATQDAPA